MKNQTNSGVGIIAFIFHYHKSNDRYSPIHLIKSMAYAHYCHLIPFNGFVPFNFIQWICHCHHLSSLYKLGFQQEWHSSSILSIDLIGSPDLNCFQTKKYVMVNASSRQEPKDKSDDRRRLKNETTEYVAT